LDVQRPQRPGERLAAGAGAALERGEREAEVQRDRGDEALIGDELLVAEVEALEPAGAESALKAAELGERLLRGEERVAGGLAGVEVGLAGREAEARLRRRGRPWRRRRRR